MSIPSFLVNCRQATLLIERRADGPLSTATRARLWAHLRLCPYCRRYELQSDLIARQARPAAEAALLSKLVLPATTRVRLQQLLAAAASSATAGDPAQNS
jgi:predicted anti-sigma-YlaC factor YlaD